METLEKENLEQPEYSFEAGVQEVIRRILEISKKQKFTIVAFNSTGQHVGKTKLAMTLTKELSDENIFVVTSHDLSVKDNIKRFTEEYPGFEKFVIILDEFIVGSGGSEIDSKHGKMINIHNQTIEEEFENTTLNIKKIDLWVGLCSPDKPFPKSFDGEPCKPLADIIIENEFAKDKII